MHSYGSKLRAVVLSLFVAAAFWGMALILVQLAQRVSRDWVWTSVAEVLASAIGVWLAVRLRTRFVACLLAGQLAFSLAELVLHARYGLASIQGGPVHFAVMLAGTLGVAMGWMLRSHRADSGSMAADAEPESVVVTA